MEDLHLDTLEGIDAGRLAEAFNASFAGYFVPMSVTADALSARMRLEGIDPAASAGAFHGDRLIGFALHAIGGRLGEMAWNGGTGVVPGFRGRKVTAALYRFLLPRLRTRGVQRVCLEVIDRNLPAISVYTRIGFRQSGLLGCYRDAGNPPEKGGEARVEIRETAFSAKTAPAGECVPTWQNSDAVIGRWEGLHCLEAFDGGIAVGYIAFRPDAGLIGQFAVAERHRRQGIGTALFRAARQAAAQPLKIINAPADHAPVAAFLQSQGMEHFLTQWAMELDLRGVS